MHSVSSEDEAQPQEEYVYLSQQRTQPYRGNAYPIIITKLQDNSKANTRQPNKQPIGEQELDPAAEEDEDFQPAQKKKKSKDRSWLETLAQYNLCQDDFFNSEDEAYYRENPSHLYLLRKVKAKSSLVPRV